MAGNAVTKNNATIMAIYKGMIGLMIWLMETLPMLHPTNNTLPTGGVHKPMDKFNIIIIPKWRGDIPNEYNTANAPASVGETTPICK